MLLPSYYFLGVLKMTKPAEYQGHPSEDYRNWDFEYSEVKAMLSDDLLVNARLTYEDEEESSLLLMIFKTDKDYNIKKIVSLPIGMQDEMIEKMYPIDEQRFVKYYRDKTINHVVWRLKGEDDAWLEQANQLAREKYNVDVD